MEFPEITSFGTVMEYALTLEADLGSAFQACGGGHVLALDAARKHEKRRLQLERLRRERLNEVVLQSVSGIDGLAFLPDPVPAEAGDALARLAANEDKAAAFYECAAGIAGNVLGGMDRTFRKMASENRCFAAELRNA